MLPYPHASEFLAYNIPRGGALVGSPLDDDSVKHSHVMVAEPLSWKEATSAHKYARKVIRPYLQTRDTTRSRRLSSLIEIMDELGDRTLPILVMSLDILDADTVSFLQSSILRRYPNWRILHCESSDRLDLNLAIYPDAISINDAIVANVSDDVLAKWKSSIASYRAATQRLYVVHTTRIQEALRASPPSFWRRAAPVVIAAFEKVDADEVVQSVWIVVCGSSPYTNVISGERLQEGTFFPIRRDGTLGRELAIRSRTKLWVREVVFPRANVQRIRLARDKGHDMSEIVVEDFE